MRLEARSGPRPAPATPLAIAAYLGTSDGFDSSMAAFAEAYARQNARDHAALVTAIAAGRVGALRGV